MFRAARLAPALLALTVVVAACGSDATEATDTTVVAAGQAGTDVPVVAEATTTVAPATTEAPTTTAAELGSIVDVATEAGTFTTMLRAIDAAGLTDMVASEQLTLLAPTDDAFAALGQPMVDALFADPAALTALVQNHLLPSPQDADMISGFLNVLTVTGGSHAVAGDDVATLTIGAAKVVTPDLAAGNGIVHGIDTVLIPAPAA